jgi:hypothetical protein
MADFYVPIATNTLSSIDSLIANAKGTEAVGRQSAGCILGGPEQRDSQSARRWWSRMTDRSAPLGRALNLIEEGA